MLISGALLATVLSATAPAGAAVAAPTKVAVLPTQIDKAGKDVVPKVIDELVLTAVHKHAPEWEVIGQEDVNAMLGFERQKELLACDDLGCIADIGGALGVEKLVVVGVAQVGGEWVITAKLIDIKKSKVEARTSEFVSGPINNMLHALTGIIQELVQTSTNPPPPAVPVQVAEPDTRLESNSAAEGVWFFSSSGGLTGDAARLPHSRYAVAVRLGHVSQSNWLLFLGLAHRLWEEPGAQDDWSLAVGGGVGRTIEALNRHLLVVPSLELAYGVHYGTPSYARFSDSEGGVTVTPSLELIYNGSPYFAPGLRVGAPIAVRSSAGRTATGAEVSLVFGTSPSTNRSSVGDAFFYRPSFWASLVLTAATSIFVFSQAPELG